MALSSLLHGVRDGDMNRNSRRHLHAHFAQLPPGHYALAVGVKTDKADRRRGFEQKGRRSMGGITVVAGRFGAAAVFGLVLFVSFAVPAAAQGLSDKAVTTFMRYAWDMTPQKFTKPDGTSVLIDKAKKDEVMVPEDKAREIILAGRMTAHASMCDLPEAQVANYQSMIRRERASKKWTEQQLIYINQLHLTTVMMLTGKIQLVEKQGDKEIVIDESKSHVQTCTEEQREKVKNIILEYIKSEPKA